MVARAIHEGSHRSTGPLVSLNCGALPETLVESEPLRACTRCITGALQDRRGHIEMANGGTLFLMRSATSPLPIQVKLLRVLQESEIVSESGKMRPAELTRPSCNTYGSRIHDR